MTTPRLELGRSQILAHRRSVGALDERLPPGAGSLRRAAWAGLQDSMPRAALLSIHARVADTGSFAWEDPSLVQVWGPRFSAFVIPAPDVAVFTLGRLSDTDLDRRRSTQIADDLEAFLAGRRMSYAEAGHGMGVDPNRLRYATVTGRVLIRWEGARRPIIWTVPAPEVDPLDARLELARRYIHVFGPGTAEGFSAWAGMKPVRAQATFDRMTGSLVPVATPVGDAWILASDEAGFRTAVPGPPAVRLLPSGDTYFLLQGVDRALLVPEPDRRGELWTPRVWPGAILVDGEVAGIWRRSGAVVTAEAWRVLTPSEREGVEAEARSLPLPDVGGLIRVDWG